MAGRAALGQRTSWLRCTQRAHCSERGVCSPQMGKPVGRIHPDGIWGLPDGTFAAWLCWVLTSQLSIGPIGLLRTGLFQLVGVTPRPGQYCLNIDSKGKPPPELLSHFLQEMHFQEGLLFK